MKNHKGFTLIEVLISLSLLSLILGLLSSSLLSMTRSTQASTEKMQALDETRTVRQFIQHQLSQIVPLSFRNSDAELTVYFRGYHNKVLYTGQLPAHRGGGGLHFLELSVDDLKNQAVLYEKAADSNSFFERSADVSTWQQYPLISDVTELKFSFYGQQTELSNLQWHDEWTYSSQLPSLIKVELNTKNNNSWYPLVITLNRLTVSGQPQWVW